VVRPVCRRRRTHVVGVVGSGSVASEDALVHSALISLGAARAIRLSCSRDMDHGGCTEYGRSRNGVGGVDLQQGARQREQRLGMVMVDMGSPVEVLLEILGIVDDLLQEAKENEKAFGIEEGRVVGEVVAAAMQLFTLYGRVFLGKMRVGTDLGARRGQDLCVLDITATPDSGTVFLNPVLHALVGAIRKIGLSTPISPPITTTLLGKSAFLTDPSALSIIRHYVSMSLVTPSTPVYLNNRRQLFHHFYKSDRSLARIELAHVLQKLGVRDLLNYEQGVVDCGWIGGDGRTRAD
ncbi:unnamed protein product, partial [Rhizoctonia solani]